MATDKLDMSLEDIIKSNKKEGRGGFSRGNRFNFSRAAGNEGRKTYGGNSSSSRRLQSVSRGGVQKRESRTSMFTQANELPDKWKHDLFEDTAISGRNLYTDRSNNDKKSGTLLISNLHYGVNDSDIKELFGEFGSLVKAAVHYDRSGRSLGTAEVVFANNGSAAQALKQYNDVPLDGQPMKITLVGDASQGQTRSISSRIGLAHTRNNADYIPQRTMVGSNNRQRRGFRNAPKQNNRRDRVVPTREELDAELDAYNAKMETDN